MGYPIFPSDLEYSLETSDVESFKGLDVFPICCPGHTTVEKDGWYTATLVFICRLRLAKMRLCNRPKADDACLIGC